MDTTRLIDPRLGIIRRVDRAPVPAPLPPAFRMFTAVLADSTRYSAWASDFAGGGYAFFDDDAARAPAIGEAIERYCGNLVPDTLHRATLRTLRTERRATLDPRSILLFATGQYHRDRFPFTPVTDDLELEWATGTDLSTGHPVLVPAQLVWISYAHAAPLRGVPFIGPAHPAGLAAGDGIDHAHWSALCQLIERDAVTVGWHGRRPLRQVRPPRWLARLAAGTDGRLRTRFVEFPNEFGLTVIGAVVGDDTDRYVAMGTAARAAAVPAMLKALAEAFQLRVFVADLDDPDGPYLRTAHEPGSPFLPWRADRRYLDDRRADLADVVEYCTHLQLYLDPRMRRRFTAELDDAVTGTIDWRDLDQTPDRVADNDLTDLVTRLDRRGQTPASVDVTTDDVRPSGLRVVHVLAPGLYTNTAAGLPLLGGTRLPAALSRAGTARRDLPLPH